MELKNKVVLITGSSIGIGSEAARLFSKEGAKVIVTYNKNKEKGQELSNEIGAKLIHLDVTDINSIKAAIKEVVSEFGHLDILINNAGILVGQKNFESQSDQEITQQINTNLLGLLLMTKHSIPHLKGMIINVASGAGKTTFREIVPYCATKFGVRGFSQGLAKELSIPVYCVNPGMTATQMTNYQGIEPKKVGQVILNTAKENLGKKSGDDIDVWKYY